jgi:hypothetical protein
VFLVARLRLHAIVALMKCKCVPASASISGAGNGNPDCLHAASAGFGKNEATCSQGHVLQPLLTNYTSDKPHYSLLRESCNHNVLFKCLLVASPLKSVSLHFCFILDGHRAEGKSRQHENSILK